MVGTVSAYAEYAAIEAVNWSTLKEIDKSPLHYQHALKNERKDSKAFIGGRAAHTATLDPDNFLRQYVICPLPDRRGNAWKEFAAAHTDKTILFENDYQKALRVRDAIRKHPVARALLDDGEGEKSITWTDPGTGIKCKGRVDWVGNALVDLKTMAQMAPRAVQQQAAKLNYHGQLGMYRDGVCATMHEVKDVFLIIAEPEPPHDVGVFRYGPDELQKGYDFYSELLRKLRDCREANIWPGRYPDEQHLELPAWVYGDDELGELTAKVVGEDNAEVY